MNKLTFTSFILLIIIMPLSITGCSSIKISKPTKSVSSVNASNTAVGGNKGVGKGVKPWERDYLAKPEMAWQPDSLQSGFLNHTYTSKEAASGGDKSAGGGCGCN